MKTTLRSALLLGGLAIGGCQSEEASPKANGLVGYWSLTQMECYCPPNSPTPNEAIEFDAAGHVTVYQNGKATQTGTYELSKGSAACATDTDIIKFSWPTFFPTASYSIAKNVLTIDQGICLDAPRKTYKLTAASKKD